MALHHHTPKQRAKITTALARAAKAGVRRVVAPTASEQTSDARKAAMERIKREGEGKTLHPNRAKGPKPKKSRRKPKTGFAGLNEALAGDRPYKE